MLRGFRNMVVWGLPDRVNPKTGEIIEHEWRDRAGELDPKYAAWSLDSLDADSAKEIEKIDIEAVSRLEHMKCPDCGKQLHGGEALPRKLLNMVIKEPVGAGYYRLEPKGAMVRPTASNNDAFKVDYQSLKSARGDDIVIQAEISRNKRRAAYISECLRLEIDWKTTARRRSVYDSYWDDPSSEGFEENNFLENNENSN